MSLDLRRNASAKGALGLMAALAACAGLGGCASMPSPSSLMGGGETLMPQYRTVSHEANYKALGLPPPSMGLRWYHVDRVYVLANPTTGLIIKTVSVAADGR